MLASLVSYCRYVVATVGGESTLCVKESYEKARSVVGTNSMFTVPLAGSSLPLPVAGRGREEPARGTVNIELVPRIVSQEGIFDVLFECHVETLGHAASEKMAKNLAKKYESISRNMCDVFYKQLDTLSSIVLIKFLSHLVTLLNV